MRLQAQGRNALTGNSPRGTPSRVPILVLSALGLFAVLIMLLGTRWGSGLGGDSYFYVSGARNLAAGIGFSRYAGTGEVRVITHFPPLYSSVLAVSAIFGVDPMSGARWINAIVFGANTLLIGLLFHRYTASPILAAFGSFVALGSRLMLTIHSWVLTEGLFVLLLLLWVFCFTQYLTYRRRSFLIAASGLAAMCFLTRYVGISVIATGLLLVALFPGRQRGRTWADTFWMAGVSLIPSALWLMRNYLLTGSHTNRVPGWHPMPLERVSDGVEAVSMWVAPDFVPAPIRYLVAAALVAVLLGAGIAAMKKVLPAAEGPGSQAEARPFLLVLWSFLLAYVVLLATSLSLFDAATPVDARILSPTFPVALLFLGTAGFLACTSTRTPRNLTRLLVVVAVFLGAVSLFQGVLTAMRLMADGQGFAGKEWRESDLIRFVDYLPQGAPIYSNEIDAIYLLTGKTGTLVPIRWDPVRDAPSESYRANLEVMRTRLTEGEGALVLFNTIERQASFLATVEDLTKGLTPVLEAADGAVYMVSAESQCPTCP